MLKNFVFTSFDKAILAAVLGPLIVFATNYVNGTEPFSTRSLVAAGLSALVSGILVYLKGNAPNPGSVPAP